MVVRWRLRQRCQYLQSEAKAESWNGTRHAATGTRTKGRHRIPDEIEGGICPDNSIARGLPPQMPMIHQLQESSSPGECYPFVWRNKTKSCYGA